jgi:hypothetical protein
MVYAFTRSLVFFFTLLAGIGGIQPSQAGVFDGLGNSGSNGNSSYYRSRGFDFGDIPGFSGGFQTGGTETILEAGFNGGSGGDFLGCSGINMFDFLETTFNMGEIVDNFTQYMKTMVAKWALTQLFSSPQLAAIFDTLQAFGNARLDMFKASCDIGEIKEEARRSFIEYCVEKQGGTTKARAQCEQNYDKGSSDVIMEAANKYLNFQAANSNLQDVLNRTNFCGQGEVSTGRPASASCALSALVPQMRLCISGGTKSSSFNTCGDINASGAQMADQIIGYPLLMTAAHNIFGAAVFRPIFGKVEDVTGQVGRDQAEFSRRNQLAKGATGQPLNILPNGNNTTAAATMFFDYDLAPVAFAQSSGNTGGTGKEEAEATIKSFKKFMQCSQDDPFADLKGFIAQVNSDWNVNIDTSDLERIPEEMQKKISEMVNIDPAIDGARFSKLTQQDLPATAMLLDTAIRCVFNHQIHLSVDTMLELQLLGVEQKGAYFNAAANRAAYLVTEVVMRFVKHKIYEAHVQLASNPKPPIYYSEPNCNGRILNGSEIGNPDTDKYQCNEENWEYQAGVLEAVLTMAKMIENQIQALQAIKEERDTFAEISARIARLRQQMGEDKN